MKTIICILLCMTINLEGAMAKNIDLLKDNDFTTPLQVWQKVGEDLELSTNTADIHSGRVPIRLHLNPQAKLAWSQIYRPFTGDFLAGDSLQATVQVRTEGLQDGSGAYMAMEFQDSSGERISIAHSQVSLDNGAKGWQQLTAAGNAPIGVKVVRINLILNSHGTAWFADPSLVRTARIEPWPDMGSALRKISIHPDKVIQDLFRGVGFHAFQHSFTVDQAEKDNVIYKRWKELAPAFARLNHDSAWDQKKLDEVATHLQRMKEAGTELYMTTWNPDDARTPEAQATYAKKVADSLDYLINKKGLDNIKWYCMTNELSLGTWGKLVSDLPLFKAYHQALFKEFKARGLKIGLLATDASPIDLWNTIDWASNNMDDITGIYGGHHYINDFLPEDERFYPWFLDKLQWGTGIAKAKGKDFILGEFGAKQDGRVVNGYTMDACVWWDTPREPLVGVQVPEAAIAAINAGIYACGYWTFMDFPDDYTTSYKNKWGIFKSTGEDRSTRSLYYAYGLLTRYFRGPASVVKVNCADPRLRVMAIQNNSRKTWSIAVISRNKTAVPLEFSLPGLKTGTAFRKYVYNPANPPQNPFGDMPGPNAVIKSGTGFLRDSAGTTAASTLTVYTTAFDTAPPAAVKGVRSENAGSKTMVIWKANQEPDLCYYRIYRGAKANFEPTLANQIGSTIATEYKDPSPVKGVHYKVVAVDQSGNAGK